MVALMTSMIERMARAYHDTVRSFYGHIAPWDEMTPSWRAESLLGMSAALDVLREHDRRGEGER